MAAAFQALVELLGQAGVQLAAPTALAGRPWWQRLGIAAALFAAVLIGAGALTAAAVFIFGVARGIAGG